MLAFNNNSSGERVRVKLYLKSHQKKRKNAINPVHFHHCLHEIKNILKPEICKYACETHDQ